MYKCFPPGRARGSSIPGDGNEEILGAEKNVTRADSLPGEQRSLVRDAYAQQREPTWSLQGSSSSMPSIDCLSAATKASG